MTKEEIEELILETQKNPNVITQISLSLATLEQLLIEKKIITEDEYIKTKKKVDCYYIKQLREKLEEENN